MLRSVYVRKLKPGVTDDDYIAAWMAPDVSREEYEAHVTISHATTDERLTITVFEVDLEPTDFLDALPKLVHPDWKERVAPLIESTDVETVFADTVTFGDAGSPQSTPTL